MRAQKGLAAAILVLSMAVASAATADPIRITSGTLDIAGVDPIFFRPSPIHLEGENGLVLDVMTASGSFDLANQCQYGCDPGTMVSLNATWNGLDLFGTATFEGHTLPVGSLNEEYGDAAVEFRASLRIPESTEAIVIATAPFEFTGSFAHPSVGGYPLVGHGRVTATFEPALEPLQGFYQPKRTLFTFAPSVVPEPGTIVLLGTGLLVTARAAWRRQRRRR